MKIFYLSGSVLPSRFANSVHVMKMSRALAAEGHQVTLFARPGDGSADPFSAYGVPPIFDLELCARPDIPVLGSLIYASNVARRARGAPDLFYARNAYALAAVARRSVPMIYEAHQLPGNPGRIAVERWLFGRPNFAKLVTISDALRQAYMRLAPDLAADKVIVAHDGADLPSVSDRGVVSGWPGRSGAIQVGYVGSLYKGKGMEVIAELAPLLPQMDFHVIGGREPDIAAWQVRARYPNLHYHGFVQHGRLASYYQAIDISVAPYQREVTLEGNKSDTSQWMSPLKLFEYMSHGKAIVASDLPVLREVLRDRSNALLCPPDDLSKWRLALTNLAEDEGLRHRIAQAAFEELQQKYTWNKRVQRIVGSA